MAKGLRSSIKKANKAQLRAEIFGPAEKERKERLSAKLLEQARKEDMVAQEQLAGLPTIHLSLFLANLTHSVRTESRDSLDKGGKDLPDAETIVNQDACKAPYPCFDIYFQKQSY